jgi:hypothetical protein
MLMRRTHIAGSQVFLTKAVTNPNMHLQASCAVEDHAMSAIATPVRSNGSHPDNSCWQLATY